MIHDLSTAQKRRIVDLPADEVHRQPSSSLCEHRSVAKDGRIVCAKIVAGDNQVTPNECRACPFRAVNCAHLRFSLRQTSPSPLVVRFNGREEVWDDGPAELRFEQAACAAKVLPVDQPLVCAACSLRQPLPVPGQEAARPPARAQGKVVPFRVRQVAAG